MILHLFLRLAKGKKKIKSASSFYANREPLWDGSYPHQKPIPTILVKLELDVPNDIFSQQIPILKQKIENAVSANEIKIREGSLRKTILNEMVQP